MTPRVAVPRWPDVAPAVVRRYHAWLEAGGLQPIDVCDPAASLADLGCDGLLLTGGVDVDTALYGEAPAPQTQPPQRERDDFELRLLREALTAALPVLAICRGLQLVNVCMGGSLLQHVPGHAASPEGEHDSAWHDVSLLPGSRLAALYGAETLRVNSRHHQAVTPERLAPGLRVAGVTADGLVEAFEGTGQGWLTAVQWHPEREEQAEFARQSAVLLQSFGAATNDRKTDARSQEQ